MKTELYSLSKFFTENIFRIPDYQRGYSWTEKQLKDFWGDIEQLENDKYHYTGVLTLEEVSFEFYNKWEDDLWIINSKKYQPYYLVDGQQRITTIIVLIQIIIEMLDDDDLINYMGKEEIRKKYICENKGKGILRSYLFGYEKDNPSYEYLKTVIFSDNSDRHLVEEKTIYTKNLLFAKQFFVEKLKTYKLVNIERVYEIITQRFLFNIYIISSDIDVCVAFETMNNRGKPLTHLELLKNRLIYLSTKFDVDISEKEKLRITINEAWKSVYYYLGINSERLLDDDIFLLTHYYVFFGKRIPGFKEYSVYSFRGDVREKTYQDFLLGSIFNARRLSVEITDEEYGDLSKIYKLEIENIYCYVQDVKECVSAFARIYNPRYSDYSEEEKINLERISRLSGYDLSYFLVSLFKEKRCDIGPLLGKVEKLLFFEGLKGYDSNINNINFYEITAKYIQGDKSLDDLGSLFDKQLTMLIKHIVDKSIINRFSSKNSGFYGWGALKYFLFEYEQSLIKETKTDRVKLKWEDFQKEKYNYDYKSIEHIYPQRVKDKYWIDRFNKYTVPQRNILKNSIGNLLAVSIPRNSSLQNKGFNQKKNEAKTGYVYGCYSEIEVAQYNDWTPKEIRGRGIKLLSFMEKRWGIKLGDNDNKVQLLGLDFLD